MPLPMPQKSKHCAASKTQTPPAGRRRRLLAQLHRTSVGAESTKRLQGISSRQELQRNIFSQPSMCGYDFLPQSPLSPFTMGVPSAVPMSTAVTFGALRQWRFEAPGTGRKHAQEVRGAKTLSRNMVRAQCLMNQRGQSQQQRVGINRSGPFQKGPHSKAGVAAPVGVRNAAKRVSGTNTLQALFHGGRACLFARHGQQQWLYRSDSSRGLERACLGCVSLCACCGYDWCRCSSTWTLEVDTVDHSL